MSRHINLYDFQTFAPDTLAVGNEAFGVYCRLLTYACLHDESGDIDSQAFVLIAGDDKWESVAKTLLSAKMIEPTRSGYRIADFKTCVEDEDE